MFDGMVELPRTAVDLLAKAHLPDTDWRGWYELYLDLEKFVGAAESLLGFLESGPEGLLTSDAVGRYVDSCNDSFAGLKRNFSALLQKLFGLMRRWPGSMGLGPVGQPPLPSQELLDDVLGSCLFHWKAQRRRCASGPPSAAHASGAIPSNHGKGHY